MTSKTAIAAAGLAGAVLCLAGSAQATHKQWIIKNGANECSYTSHQSGLGRGQDLDFPNYLSTAKFVECPIWMAGRWGAHDSTGGTVFWQASSELWAAVSTAKIVVDNENSSPAVSCTLTARNTAGATFFSRTVNASGMGEQTLEMVNTVNGVRDLGGSINAVRTNPSFVSFEFSCNLPPPSSTGQTSGLLYYQIDPCQDPTNPNCGPATGTDLGGTCAGEEVFIQTSGIQCTPLDPTITGLVRNSLGISNRSTTETYSVHCPLSQPTDDTNFHQRSVKEVHVFYDGGDNFLDCLDRGTCPTCLLEGRKHSGSSFAQSVGFESTTMVPDPGSPQNTQNMVLTAMSIEWDASSGVYCSVPPGITIKGVAARVTESIVISAF